jgi:hypothetical protein
MSAQREQKEKIQAIIRRFGKLGIIIVVLLIVFEIWAENRLSTYGNKLAQLKRLEAQLELDNRILETKIIEFSSLQTIDTKASALGFTQTKNVEAIKSQNIASSQ